MHQSEDSRIQIQALAAVLREQDPEYNLRSLFRWYSRTFHTPLHEVPDLPLDDILRTWWESYYESLTPEQLETERKRLAETEAEARARRLAEDVDQVGDDEFLQMTETEEAKRLARGTAEDKNLDSETALPNVPFGKALGNIIPPDIDMKFSDPDWEPGNLGH